MLNPAPLPVFYTKQENLALCSYACSWQVDDQTEKRLRELKEQGEIEIPVPLQAACEKRRFEFVAGRYCAKQALAELGYATATANSGGASKLFTLPWGVAREPVWPAPFVGSITHCQGFAAATVALAGTHLSLGIDVEPLLEGEKIAAVARRVAREGAETFCLSFGLTEQQYFTLLFSAKESIFKCLFPLVKKHFFYQDAEIIAICQKYSTFRFRLLKDLDTSFTAGFEGRGYFEILEERMHTGVFLKN